MVKFFTLFKNTQGKRFKILSYKYALTHLSYWNFVVHFEEKLSNVCPSVRLFCLDSLGLMTGQRPNSINFSNNNWPLVKKRTIFKLYKYFQFHWFIRIPNDQQWNKLTVYRIGVVAPTYKTHSLQTWFNCIQLTVKKSIQLKNYASFLLHCYLF